MADQTAPIGSRWRLADRDGWHLSGNEMEVLAVLGDGRTTVRLGLWSVKAVRVCLVTTMTPGDLADLLRGAVRARGLPSTEPG